MMKKRVLAMALSFTMAVTVLAGCGGVSGAGGGRSDAGQQASDLEPVTLTWYLDGSNVIDDADVMAEVNAYLQEKLNVTLNPIWGTWGDFDTGVVNALQDGDDVDIYFTCSWSADEYNKYAKDGYWVRLDDPANNLLAIYASDIWKQLPQALRDGAIINGSDGTGVYAIPGWKDYAAQYCWDVNVSLLEKYGYTVDDIANTDFYGFGEILETVKAGEGEGFYPLLAEGLVLERMATHSVVVTGDSGTVNLMSYYIDPTDVSKPGPAGNVIQNKFATPEYEKFVKQVREYYLAGYIDPAMANPETANDKRTQIQAEGNYLIGTQAYSMGYEVQASAERGFEVAMVPCTPAYVDTTAAQGAMMAVSSVSKNPERAVMFLNLLNTDPYLMTLLEYGIEGVHYSVNDAGEIVFHEEARKTYAPWTNGMGNVTQLPPLEGQGANFQQEFIDFYAQATGIPILGYTFNQTKVDAEMSASVDVAQQYALQLSVGAVDPETALPELLRKLERSGIQKIIDEANAQLRERFPKYF